MNAAHVETRLRRRRIKLALQDNAHEFARAFATLAVTVGLWGACFLSGCAILWIAVVLFGVR